LARISSNAIDDFSSVDSRLALSDDVIQFAQQFSPRIVDLGRQSTPRISRMVSAITPKNAPNSFRGVP